MSQFQLTSELLKLSFAKTWDEAKLEWDLVDVEKVSDLETCLCGHYPISEVCVIKNRKNHKVTRVGNCCVKKFNERSGKIFQAYTRIKKDTEKSLNAETIDFAFQKNWINDRERNFYMDIFRKRKLSEKQLAWKISVNKKILSKIKV